MDEPTRDTERHAPLMRRPAFRAMIQDFEPVWFTWCMNSGILSILLHQLPYQFHGLPVLSTILFLVDLVLFVLFSLFFLLRFFMFGKTAYHEVTGDSYTLTMLACWPIAWLTLLSLVSLTVSQAYWGGYRFALVGYTMWWIGAIWILATLLFVFIHLIRRHDIFPNRPPTTIIIPAVGVSTVAVAGGITVNYGSGMTAQLAIPIIVTSFMFNGIGIFLGTILSAYLFQQLLAKGWPAPAQTTSMFVFLGPFGQCAAALQILGTAARRYFGTYNRGTFLTKEAAIGLDSACVLFAFCISGMGLLLLLLSICAMLERAFSRQLSWSPGWNSIIFPTATVVTSMSLFATDMDSPAFRVITTIMVVALVLVYLVNLGYTLWRVYQGELLIVREDPRARRQVDGQQKEK